MAPGSESNLTRTLAQVDMVLVLSDKFKGSYGLIERNRVKKPAGKSGAE